MTRAEHALEEKARERWGQLIDLDERQARVLESLRFRDQDHHVRSGALLGFSGLIIASVLVHLSAEPGTIAYMARTSPWLLPARVGLILLLGSAALSMVSISMGRRRYSNEPWIALEEFERLINLRARTEIGAICLCAVGSLASLASLIAGLFTSAT
jgi:hypothetical protein